MENWHEWLNLVLRWFHVIAGISWIGSSFYFMWLDKHIEPPTKPDPDVAGSLWMVHSGGFYRVEKRYLAAGQVPQNLHWFKWEAAFTWLSGFVLLIVVYHLGGIAIDSSNPNQTEGLAFAVGMGVLVLSWVVYDLLWVSPLGEKTKLASALSFALLVATSYSLNFFMGGRAAYIYTGAIMGTLMVANVWMRILPAQRQMIAATQKGETRDLTLGERAKKRSVHNNYMTLPVVFIMISNHFPSTYGNDRNWLVLAVIMLAGAGIRHHMNVKGMASGLIALASAIAIATLCYLT